MKLLLKALTLAALTFVLAGHFSANAQGGGGFGGGAPNPNLVTGTVTAIDTTANTITVENRRTQEDTTVALTSSTKYTKQTVATVAAVTVGSLVTVRAADEIAAGATTVAAAQIGVVLELPKPNPNAPANPQYGNRSISGTVLTITPALTIKTADGTTVTITTDDTTRYSQTVPAALTDVAVGNNVMIDTTTNGTTVTATAVHIVPARRRGGFGGGGGGGQGGPGGGAPPPAGPPA